MKTLKRTQSDPFDKSGKIYLTKWVKQHDIQHDKG